MTNPKISVCIPAYYQEKYLQETIDSILNQTLEDYEIIITDDTPNDTVKNIVQKYQSCSKTIRYYKNAERKGMARNWNKSVLLARGKYIKILCGDDTIEPQHLEVFSRVLDKHNEVSLVTSFEQLIGDCNKIRKTPEIPMIGEIKGHIAQKMLIEAGNWVGSPSSVMFRRKDLHVGIFNCVFDSWMLDIDMWIRLLKIGNLYVIPEILTHNRIHNERQTSSGNYLNFIQEEFLFYKFILNFPEIYGRHKRKDIKKTLFNLFDRLIHELIRQKKLNTKIAIAKIAAKNNPFMLCNVAIKKIFTKIINGPTNKIKKLVFNIEDFSPKDFFWQKKFSYKAKPENINIIWKKVDTIGIITIPTINLYAKIFTPEGAKIETLENTPHFIWIRDLVNGVDNENSKIGYKKYIKTFFPEADVEAQIEKIKKLVRQFENKVKNEDDLKITSYIPTRKKGSKCYSVVIFDGIHRASIVKAMGKEELNIHIVDKKIDANNFCFLS